MMAGRYSEKYEERVRRLAPDEKAFQLMMDFLSGKSPSEKERFLSQFEGIMEKKPLGPLNFSTPSVPAAPTCKRCSSRIKGAYMSFKRPSGGSVSLCKTCARRIRLRLRILGAKPNSTIRSMAKSALRDLREATRLDPGSKQIQKNITNIGSILSAVNGSWFKYIFLWVPLWALAGIWSLIQYLIIPFWVCALCVVDKLWDSGGIFKLLAVFIVMGPIVLILLIFFSWVGRKVNELTTIKYY